MVINWQLNEHDVSAVLRLMRAEMDRGENAWRPYWQRLVHGLEESVEQAQAAQRQGLEETVGAEVAALQRRVAELEAAVRQAKSEQGISAPPFEPELIRVNDWLQQLVDLRQAEAVLRESEANMAALLESTKDIIASRDQEGRLVIFNSAYARFAQKLFGLQVRPGVRTTDYLPPDQRAYWVGVIERVLRGERHREEFSHEFETGEVHYYDLTFHPIRRGTEIVGFTEFTRDITERKRIEMALRDAEEWQRTLFNGSLDAILVAELDSGLLVDCNEAAVELTGRSRAELIGQHQRILHPPEEQENGFSHGFKLRRQGMEGQVLEAQVLRRDGQVRDVAIKGHVYEYRGQQLLLGVFHDITDRKRAEAALRESEARYRTISELISDSAYSVRFEPDGGLRQEWSTGVFRRILGTEDGALLDMERVLQTIHPEDRHLFEQRVERFEAGQEYVNEYRVIDKNGNFIWLRDHGQAELDETTGRLRRVVGAAVNITGQKQAEVEREELIADLVEALARVKRLSGLLPICMSCKKIRDDGGYWQQVETYIRQHAEVEFSHGLCPECKVKLYPPESYPYLYDPS